MKTEKSNTVEAGYGSLSGFRWTTNRVGDARETLKDESEGSVS